MCVARFIHLFVLFFVFFNLKRTGSQKWDVFRNSTEELARLWNSPLYFPPLKTMGNPDAPPAKSLIIRSTFSGSLPPLGLVQSTVFRIMWPANAHANSRCKCVGGNLAAAPSRERLYLCTQRWCRCPFLGGHRPSGSWIWDAHQPGTLQTISTLFLCN